MKEMLEKVYDSINEKISSKLSPSQIKNEVVELIEASGYTPRHFETYYFKPDCGCSLRDYINEKHLEYWVAEYDRAPVVLSSKKASYRGILCFLEKYFDYKNAKRHILKNFICFKNYWAKEYVENDYEGDYLQYDTISVQAYSIDEAERLYLETLYETEGEWVINEVTFHDFLRNVFWGDIFESDLDYNNQLINLGEEIYDKYYDEKRDIDDLVYDDELRKYWNNFFGLVPDVKNFYIEAMRHDISVIEIPSREEYLKSKNVDKNSLVCDSDSVDLIFLDLCSKLFMNDSSKDYYRIKAEMLTKERLAPELIEQIKKRIKTSNIKSFLEIETDERVACFPIFEIYDNLDDSFGFYPSVYMKKLIKNGYVFSTNNLDLAKEILGDIFCETKKIKESF